MFLYEVKWPHKGIPLLVCCRYTRGVVQNGKALNCWPCTDGVPGAKRSDPRCAQRLGGFGPHSLQQIRAGTAQPHAGYAV